MINLILFGAPGSGKGTQSANLVQRYQLMHVSTGDILRAEIKAETELGLKAKTLIEAGHLVPDEVIIGMMEDLVASHPDVKGFVFDGFPRTIPQADALKAMLAKRGHKIAAMIELFVPEEELMKRLVLRGQQSGRSDDNEETIKKRLNVYHTQTSPLIDWYKKEDIHHHVEGLGTIDDIFGRIATVIEEL